jgi:hypothetical protein
MKNFIPIFNILYENQKVDIAVNGDVIEGYQIKNGVKQILHDLDIRQKAIVGP